MKRAKLSLRPYIQTQKGLWIFFTYGGNGCITASLRYSIS